MARLTLHKLKLGLSNAYLIKADGCILVDTGAPNEEKRILAALKNHGVTNKDISLIVHTHVHSDHVGSTVALKQTINAPLAYHPADEPLMQQGNNGKLNGIGLRGAFYAKLFSHKAFEAFSADLNLQDGLRLDDYGVPATVLHTAGHTAGSISLILDSGDAIVGDVLMGGHMGGNFLAQKPNYQYFAEDKTQLHNSLKKLAAQPIKSYLVGHGGPLEAKKVKNWLESVL